MKLRRTWRGLASSFGAVAFPLGSWWCGSLEPLRTPGRLDRGLVILLPGIQGKSCVEFSLARGLIDGDVPYAIEVHDWTTGVFVLAPYHLRAWQRNRRAARALAARIGEYQDRYPGRPVILIGHSGGAGLGLLTLEALPPGRSIAAAILLAAAVSPEYNLDVALSRTDRGIWSFWSPLDVLFLCLGTLLLGTFDGRHTIGAGARGFRRVQSTPGSSSSEMNAPALSQQCYTSRMLRSWNFGGHFGWTNRVFSAEWLAPVVMDQVSSARVPGVERSEPSGGAMIGGSQGLNPSQRPNLSGVLRVFEASIDDWS